MTKEQRTTRRTLAFVLALVALVAIVLVGLRWGSDRSPRGTSPHEVPAHTTPGGVRSGPELATDLDAQSDELTRVFVRDDAGRAVAGARVSVAPAHSVLDRQFAQTDTDGLARFRDVDAGIYRVDVVHDDFVAQFGVFEFPGDCSIVLKSGCLVSLSLQAFPSPAWRNVRIETYDRSGVRRVFECVRPSITLGHLEPGTRSIRLELGDYRIASYSVAIPEGGVLSIPIPAPSQVPVLFEVVDGKGGAAVSAWSIELSNVDNETEYRAGERTPAEQDGRFQVAMHEGGWAFLIRAPGYGPAHGRLHVGLEPDARIVRVTMSPARTVTVRSDQRRLARVLLYRFEPQQAYPFQRMTMYSDSPTLPGGAVSVSDVRGHFAPHQLVGEAGPGQQCDFFNAPSNVRLLAVAIDENSVLSKGVLLEAGVDDIVAHVEWTAADRVIEVQVEDPPPDLRVLVFGTRYNWTWIAAKNVLDRDGIARFVGFDPKAGYRFEARAGAARLSESVDGQALVHGAKTRFVFSLSDPPAAVWRTVRIEVKDDTGRVIPGARISSHNGAAERPDYLTDSRGIATCRARTDMKWAFGVGKRGHQPIRFRAEEREVITCELPRSVVLEVLLSGVDDRECKVEILRNGKLVRTTTCRVLQSGLVRIDGLSAGEYVVRVGERSAPVHLSPGVRARVAIPLR